MLYIYSYCSKLKIKKKTLTNEERTTHCAKGKDNEYECRPLIKNQARKQWDIFKVLESWWSGSVVSASAQQACGRVHSPVPPKKLKC
jgi:hypothetical protein